MNSKITLKEQIISRIYIMRDHKVMLDQDLAKLYGVTTKRLNEQVTRNLKRFPDDFMFTLSQKELTHLKSQIATASWGGRRNLPRVFTESGIAMLASALKSDKAIDVNIQIIRVFTELRKLMNYEEKLINRLKTLEQHTLKNQAHIQTLFKYLSAFQESKDKPKIGF